MHEIGMVRDHLKQKTYDVKGSVEDAILPHDIIVWAETTSISPGRVEAAGAECAAVRPPQELGGAHAAHPSRSCRWVAGLTRNAAVRKASAVHGKEKEKEKVYLVLWSTVELIAEFRRVMNEEKGQS